MNLKLTGEAKDRLKKEYSGKSLRILIKSIGWGGPVFGLSLDEITDQDEVYSEENLEIIVEKNLINRFEGFSIDYIDKWFRKGYLVSPFYSQGGCN